MALVVRRLTWFCGSGADKPASESTCTKPVAAVVDAKGNWPLNTGAQGGVGFGAEHHCQVKPWPEASTLVQPAGMPAVKVSDQNGVCACNIPLRNKARIGRNLESSFMCRTCLVEKNRITKIWLLPTGSPGTCPICAALAIFGSSVWVYGQHWSRCYSCFLTSLAQVSLSVTVRLNTGFPGVVSGSVQKYPRRVNW